MHRRKLVRALFGMCWTAEAVLGRLRRFWRSEETGVICLMFHNPFRDKNEAHSGGGFPGEEITVAEIEQCLKQFKTAGYHFISPVELNERCGVSKRSVLLTFDDGYYNCLHVLPVLEAYSAPAMFFVVSNPVLKGEVFWWDAVYRGELRNGGSDHTAAAVVGEFKTYAPTGIRERVLERYGTRAFDVKSDAFRPMTREELRRLADHPLVTIGSHTRDHVALDCCEALEMEKQIIGCKQDLEGLIGKEIEHVAYPYGKLNQLVIETVQKAGFKAGFCCEEGRNEPGLRPNYALKRFNLQGWWNIAIQSERCLSNLPLTPYFKMALMWAVHLRASRLQGH